MCGSVKTLKRKHTIVGDHSLVGEEASLKKSILWNHTYVGYQTEIRGQSWPTVPIKIRGSGLRRAVLGEGCTVGSKAVIKPEVRTWPEKYLESGSVLNSSLVWGNRWGTNLFGRQGVDKTANLGLPPSSPPNWAWHTARYYRKIVGWC